MTKEELKIFAENLKKNAKPAEIAARSPHHITYQDMKLSLILSFNRNQGGGRDCFHLSVSPMMPGYDMNVANEIAALFFEGEFLDLYAMGINFTPTRHFSKFLEIARN